jgi:hypothetical protein
MGIKYFKKQLEDEISKGCCENRRVHNKQLYCVFGLIDVCCYQGPRRIDDAITVEVVSSGVKKPGYFRKCGYISNNIIY